MNNQKDRIFDKILDIIERLNPIISIELKKDEVAANRDAEEYLYLWELRDKMLKIQTPFIPKIVNEYEIQAILAEVEIIERKIEYSRDIVTHLKLQRFRDALLKAWQQRADTKLSGQAKNSAYDLRKVHNLLDRISTEDDLRDFCLVEPDFRPVREQLKEDDRKPKILRFTLVHADQKGLIDQLLDWARKTNPTRYEEGKPYRIED